MSGLRQVLIGLLIVLVMGLIIIGAISLSNSERKQSSVQPANQTQEVSATIFATSEQQKATPTTTPVSSAIAPLKSSVATEPQVTNTPVESTYTATVTPAESEGEGELIYRSLLPGAFMEVPNINSVVIIQEQATEVTPTATEQAKTKKSKSCSPPRGWSAYTVRRGDTLSRLSQRLGVSVAQIKKANCLGGSNKLKVGKTIYLPHPSYAPYMAPPMGIPLPPPSMYYRPSRNPSSVQPTQPIVIITMPPGTPNAALPEATEQPLIDRAFIGNLVYNATHF
jgi:LysM repeat protein